MNDESKVREKVYRVLIVDDDELFRNAHKRMLHRDGCACVNEGVEAVAVDSAANALKALNETAFDCVLLDYMMPDCDGLKCLKDIGEGWPGLPVILFTGIGNEDAVADALKEGAADCLIKGNVSPDSIRSTILKAIVRAAATRQEAGWGGRFAVGGRDRVSVNTPVNQKGCSYENTIA